MKFNPTPSTLQLGMGEYFVYSNKQKAQFQKRTFSEKKKEILKSRYLWILVCSTIFWESKSKKTRA